MEIRISRKTPGCIVFLLDRSGSMGRRVRDGGTLADSAAMFVNAALMDICRRSQKALSQFRPLFDVAVLGYGFAPGIGPDSVVTALGGDLAEESFCDPAALAQNQVPGQERAWVTPAYGGRTPMCQALAAAGVLLYDWAHAHAESPPPVVVNMSDGMATDSPYEGADLEKWHDRLSHIRTKQGVVKVFDLALTPETDRPVLRPATNGSLADPGWTVPQVATFLPGVGMSLWASSSWLRAEEDRTAPEFLRRAELADDSISGMLVDRRA